MSKVTWPYARLCAETTRCLDRAAARLAARDPEGPEDLDGLVAILADLDLAAATLDDALTLAPVSLSTAELEDRHGFLLEAWRHACRSDGVRQSLAASLGCPLEAPPRPQDGWVLWAFYGRPGRDARSEVFLAAFSVLDRPSHGYASGAAFYCLWCPPGVPPAAGSSSMVWVCDGQVLSASWPEAEVAAALWVPTVEDSDFAGVSSALATARLLLR